MNKYTENKNSDILPSRKVSSTRALKSVIIIFLSAVICLSLLAIPFYSKIADYINNKNNIRYYFDDNGFLCAVVGKYSHENISDDKEALSSLEEIRDELHLSEDYESDLVLETKSEVGGQKIYRFKQYYRDIEVDTGYVTVCADKNGKLLGMSSSYVPNIGDYITNDEFNKLKDNYTVKDAEIYSLSDESVPIFLTPYKDKSKPVIYLGENGAPSCGRYCEMLSIYNGAYKSYAVIFDAFSSVATQIREIPAFEKTENPLIDNAQDVIISSGEALSVKYAIEDLWNAYINLSWSYSMGNDDEKTDIKNTMLLYEEYKTSDDLPIGLVSNELIKNDNTQYAPFNSYIISHAMYNIYFYCMEKDFNQTAVLFINSLKYMSGEVSIADFRRAVEIACDELAYTVNLKKAVSDCLNAAHIETNYSLIMKKDYNSDMQTTIFKKAEIPADAQGVSQKDIDAVLEKELEYLKENYDVKKTSVFLEDLSHDGLPEMVVVDFSRWKSDESLWLEVFTYKDGKISSLYEKSALTTRTEYSSVMIYKANGRAYLYTYDPLKWLGVGNYSHEIFYFDDSGDKITYDTGKITFGQELDYTAESQSTVDYINKNLFYIENSLLCMSTYPKADFYNLDISDNLQDAIDESSSCDGYGKSNYKDEFERLKSNNN